jgi:hypothetical protein
MTRNIRSIRSILKRSTRCALLFDVSLQKHSYYPNTPGKRQPHPKVELFGWLKMYVIFGSVPMHIAVDVRGDGTNESAFCLVVV